MFILRIFDKVLTHERVVVTTGIQSPLSGLHSELIFVVAAAVLVWLFVVLSFVRKDMVTEKKTKYQINSHAKKLKPNKFTRKCLTRLSSLWD